MIKPDSPPIEQLKSLMEALRNPKIGCPWDVEQNFDSIAAYTIEEAYEVADAISRRDMVDLKEELGDLLFQVIFHSQMAHESGQFNFDDVAQTITEKMVRRHPHVFGDADHRTADDQTIAWEAQKAAERALKSDADSSILANIPVGLPALTRAEKLTKRAARVGFDWPQVDQVFDKLTEEIDEVHEAIAENDSQHIEEEIGDVLFVLANLARKLNIDPETALRNANQKFERRFRSVEENIKASGQDIKEVGLDAMEDEWQSVKRT
jgi:MazG family protein